VVVDGELVGEPGHGTFIARETPDWSQYPVFVTQVLRTGGYVVGTREVPGPVADRIGPPAQREYNVLDGVQLVLAIFYRAT